MDRAKNQNFDIVIPNYQQVSRINKHNNNTPAATKTTTTTTTIVQDQSGMGQSNLGYGAPLASQANVAQNAAPIQYAPQNPQAGYYPMQGQGISPAYYY